MVIVDCYPYPGLLIRLLALTFACAALGLPTPGAYRRALALLIMLWSANALIEILLHLRGYWGWHLPGYDWQSHRP